VCSSDLNFDSGNITVELAATPGVPAAPADSGAATSEPVVATPAAATGGLPLDNPGAARAFPAAANDVSNGSLTYPSGPAAGEATTAASDVSATGAPPASSGEAPRSTAAVRPGPARPAVDFWDHVPAPTVLLLPVALGLALVVSLTLGPAGRPAAVFRREGGLSRALARRSPGRTEAA